MSEATNNNKKKNSSHGSEFYLSRDVYYIDDK